MRGLTGKFFLLTLSLTALWAFQPLSAYSSDPLAPYIEAAKKEGEVRVGITLRSTRYGKPAGKLYIDAFKKRYPFLNVHFKRIGGARERERIITEMTAGIINFDVATVSETMIPTIMDAKLPRIVDLAKIGVPKTLAHPRNIGVSLRTPIFGIGYNRTLVPDAEAQKFTWETCTDPKWKGLTAMDDRPRFLNRLYMDDAWGKEKALDFARRWAANKPHIEASRSTGAAKLETGAYSLICGIARTQVRELQYYNNSKTIGIVFPEPVPVGVGDLMYVPDKAKNPNAGILFLAWAATREAQNILDAVNFSGHPDFEGNEIEKVLKGKKVSYATWEDTAHADEILAEILNAMGIPVVR